MKKIIHNIIILTSIFVTGIGLILMSAGIVYADDCFNINNESIDKNTNTRPFICFEHDIHNETAGIENCSECHHIYDEHEELVPDESSEGQPCSECHADSKNSNNTDIGLAAKYHKLCRDCHLSREKGPVVCGECHRK
ncbi:MAG: cytochrome c3 family protein [Desulfamplus sp.]|nr:cytochrome c3 family protein [Desulfamplus sp.]MBF0257864.1 cytochrome c3 family protein [Desulfamplus sp.]